jgi:heme/copper-type cytochrome/quinol oxidase subunit 2
LKSLYAQVKRFVLTVILLPVSAQVMGGPRVSVENQTIVESRVVIAKVVSEDPGWLVIHTEADGKPGKVIGYIPIKAGRNINLSLPVDATKATDSLFAMLHTDAGIAGLHEFPGPDAPFQFDGSTVMSLFQVGEIQAARIDMKARKFQFTPEVVRIKAGTPVELHIVSEDVTHGIWFRGLGINERLEKGKKRVIRFTPTKTRQYIFSCSVVCGSGHMKMQGKLIVE